MARRVDRFRPIVCWSLVLIQHGSCGFYERSVLPLHNTILLWSVWNRKLMLDSFFIKNCSMLVFLNSVPLSLLTLLILTSNLFWALLANFLKISCTSLFSRKRIPKWNENNHQQLQNHICYHQCLYKRRVQICPCEATPMAFRLSQHSWRDV